MFRLDISPLEMDQDAFQASTGCFHIEKVRLEFCNGLNDGKPRLLRGGVAPYLLFRMSST